MLQTKSRFNIIIKYVAIILLIFFLWQDILWAYPDITSSNTVQAQTIFTNPTQAERAVGMLIEGQLEHSRPAHTEDIKIALSNISAWIQGLPDNFGYLRHEINEKTHAEILIHFSNGSILRYYNPQIHAPYPGFYVSKINEKYLHKQIITENTLSSATYSPEREGLPGKTSFLTTPGESKRAPKKFAKSEKGSISVKTLLFILSTPVAAILWQLVSAKFPLAQILYYAAVGIGCFLGVYIFGHIVKFIYCALSDSMKEIYGETEIGRASKKYTAAKPKIVKPWAFWGDEILRTSSWDAITENVLQYADLHKEEDVPLVILVRFKSYWWIATGHAFLPEIKSDKKALKLLCDSIHTNLQEEQRRAIIWGSLDVAVMLEANRYTLYDSGLYELEYETGILRQPITKPSRVLMIMLSKEPDRRDDGRNYLPEASGKEPDPGIFGARFKKFIADEDGFFDLERVIEKLIVLYVRAKKLMRRWLAHATDLKQPEQDTLAIELKNKTADTLAVYIDEAEARYKPRKNANILKYIKQRKDYELKFLRPLYELFFKRLSEEFEGSEEFVDECREIMYKKGAYALRHTLNKMDVTHPLLKKFYHTKENQNTSGAFIDFYGIILFYLTDKPKKFLRHLYGEFMKTRDIRDITVAKKGISYHVRGDSVVHFYPKYLLFAGRDSHFMDSIKRRYDEVTPRERMSSPNAKKVRKAIDLLKTSCPDLEDRVKRLEQSASVVELDMKTSLLFSDAQRSIVRLVHVGRSRRVFYFSKRYLDNLDINDTSHMKELAFWLNTAQRFLDKHDDLERSGLDHKKQHKALFEFNLRSLDTGDDSGFVEPGNIRQRLDHFMREDFLRKYKEVFEALIKEEEKAGFISRWADTPFPVSLNKLTKAKDIYSRSMYRYEALNLCTMAERAYRKLEIMVTAIQLRDVGILPCQCQVELVFMALRFGHWDDFITELEILLTGKGWPRYLLEGEIDVLRLMLSPSSDGPHSFEADLRSILSAQLEATGSVRLEEIAQKADRLLKAFYENSYRDLREGLEYDTRSSVTIPNEESERSFREKILDIIKAFFKSDDGNMNWPGREEKRDDPEIFLGESKPIALSANTRYRIQIPAFISTKKETIFAGRELYLEEARDADIGKVHMHTIRGPGKDRVRVKTDQSGKFVLPKRFRDKFSSGSVTLTGAGDHIIIHDTAEWEKELTKYFKDPGIDNPAAIDKAEIDPGKGEISITQKVSNALQGRVSIEKNLEEIIPLLINALITSARERKLIIALDAQLGPSEELRHIIHRHITKALKGVYGANGELTDILKNLVIISDDTDNLALRINSILSASRQSPEPIDKSRVVIITDASRLGDFSAFEGAAFITAVNSSELKATGNRGDYYYPIAEIIFFSIFRTLSFGSGKSGEYRSGLIKWYESIPNVKELNAEAFVKAFYEDEDSLPKRTIILQLVPKAKKIEHEELRELYEAAGELIRNA